MSNKIKTKNKAKVEFEFSIKKDRAVHEWRNFEQNNGEILPVKFENYIQTKSFSLLSADTFITTSKTYAFM